MTNRAVAEMGSARIAVEIDGKWCSERLWYTADLPVFIAEDGTEVDIRDDGSILYESPNGAVQSIEPTKEKRGLRIYEPLSIHPVDVIKVWDLEKRPQRTEPADFGGGESTGVQTL